MTIGKGKLFVQKFQFMNVEVMRENIKSPLEHHSNNRSSMQNNVEKKLEDLHYLISTLTINLW